MSMNVLLIAERCSSGQASDGLTPLPELATSTCRCSLARSGQRQQQSHWYYNWCKLETLQYRSEVHEDHCKH